MSFIKTAEKKEGETLTVEKQKQEQKEKEKAKETGQKYSAG